MKFYVFIITLQATVHAMSIRPYEVRELRGSLHNAYRHDVERDIDGGFRTLSVQNDLGILSEMLTKTKANTDISYRAMVKDTYSAFSASEIRELLLLLGK